MKKRILAALLLGAAPALASVLAEPIPGDAESRILQSADLWLALLPLALLAGLGFFFRPAVPRNSAAWGLAALLLLFAGGAGLRLDATVTNDEQAYLLQARIFAEGRLSEPLPEPSCPPGLAHCPLHRRQVYEDAARGRRYAKYPPGIALALAPGAWLGFPALTVFLAGAADLLLLAAVARRYGLAAPGGAVLLFAATPFFLLVQTSFQSEVFTLPAALLGFLLLLRWRDGQGSTFLCGAGLGACAGWIFWCRPLTGVVFALSCLPGLLLFRAGAAAPRRRAAALLGALAGGLPFLAAALLYNWAQTGAWLTTPYELYAQRFGPFDAASGAPLDVYGRGAFGKELLRQGARWSVALGGALGAAGLGFWGLWRLRRRDGGSALLFSTLLPAAYAFHWYPGHWAYLGPLYCFESLGLLTLGAWAVLADIPARWRAAALYAVLIAGPLFFLQRYALIAEQVAWRAAPERAAAQLEAGAVLLLPWYQHPVQRERFLKLHTPSRDARQEGVVIVRDLPGGAQRRAALERLGLSGRPLYLFLPGDRPDDFRVQALAP